MNIKLKRALNTFVLGFGASLAALLLADQNKISDAVTVGDWTSLRILVLPILVGAIASGVRALQSNTPLPSPEPSENK
jgi:hypothetical protein